MRLLFIALLFIPSLVIAQITGKVVGVHDGDTFTLLVDGNRKVKVRLHGIDCPEIGQPYGRVARDTAAAYIAGKTLTIDSLTRDRYGRVIAKVNCGNGVVLNEVLLKTGLAWHYKRYDKSELWSNYEVQARAERKGLWIEPDALPPWDWRKLH